MVDGLLWWWSYHNTQCGHRILLEMPLKVWMYFSCKTLPSSSAPISNLYIAGKILTVSFLWLLSTRVSCQCLNYVILGLFACDVEQCGKQRLSARSGVLFLVQMWSEQDSILIITQNPIYLLKKSSRGTRARLLWENCSRWKWDLSYLQLIYYPNHNFNKLPANWE